MSHRKTWMLGSSLLLVAALAVGVLLYPQRPGSPRRSGDGALPYYKRTGFLSEFLQDAHHGPTGLSSIAVPEGFQVSLAAGPGVVRYPMFASFDDRGRLFVCESAGRNISDEEMDHAPEMRIRLLEDRDHDGVFDRQSVFADRISMAMGAQWYRGALYVAAPPDILRFEDADGDGVAERRDVLLTGWPLHSNGTTLHGPYLAPDGWMYLTYNVGKYTIKTKEGTTLSGPGGRVFRFRPDGSGLEWIIGGGYDNGIEMVFNVAGEMFGTMTYYRNPRMGERDALLHYVEGGVYPKPHPIADTYKRTGDLMPAMTKFARVAPAGLLFYRGEAFGPGWKGNLFSAHFNPHRVLRHVMERDGATFRTRDEDFLVSSDPDFHPTDIAEDADGSLLVVETGAWYLHSCPVSRIAKPEYTGAIYRVRRSGAQLPVDPWGLSLTLETKPPAELAGMLGDNRPAVRDKARDLLIRAGAPSVEALVRVRETHAAPDVRAGAVFALARIGTEAASTAVRAALDDPHLEVRIAAARMAGMSRDGAAMNRLMELVRRDHPAARRQAATALGQINDARAVPALLAAAADVRDRFLEHSIIYSLIRLDRPQPAIEALQRGDVRIRKAALIALDQMDAAPLRREQLAANLNHGDAELRRAALWVASRHPEWSREVLQSLSTRFEPEEARGALVSICARPEAQKWIADRLARGVQTRVLLDVIDACPEPRIPTVWTEQVARLLRGTDSALRASAVTLIRSRQITALDGELEELALRETEEASVRVSALGVLAPRRELSAASFDFLLAQLRPDRDADLRQSAAHVLGRARLGDAQLRKLAAELGPADPLILPPLLSAFRKPAAEDVGLALVAGLQQSRYSAEGIVAQQIPEILEQFPAGVHAKAAPLLARIERERVARAGRLHEMEALLRGGDIDRGHDIFFGNKAGCASCHTIMEDGGDVGPDLTGIGAVRAGLDLLEAIVYPSASFVPGHEVYRVETDREVFTGVRGEGSRDEVVIISGPNDRVRIPRSEVRSMRPSPVSLMPDGFADNLSRRELADLLAFLQAQKSRPTQGVALSSFR